MAWRMVMRRIPNRWVTAVGDVAQTSEPGGTTSWQKMLEPYVAQRWKLAELTVNYRTPAEIMDVAADVLALIDPQASVPRSIRESGVAPVAIRTDHLADTISKVIASNDVGGITAILVPHGLLDELQSLADTSVSVMTVRDAKGLEFDSVIVVEPADILTDAVHGRNDLYVALTRATQRLTVVHKGDLPAELARLD